MKGRGSTKVYTQQMELDQVQGPALGLINVKKPTSWVKGGGVQICRFVNGMACLPHAKGLARAYNYIDWQCCARLSALPWSIGGQWGGHDWVYMYVGEGRS